MMNPALAPAGKSSLMLQSRASHRWMDNWGGGDRERYRLLKEKAMQTLIDRTAGLIPGLQECIEHKDAATPLTYERFTQNTMEQVPPGAGTPGNCSSIIHWAPT